MHLLHAAATWAMAGLIWTMQLVHYPSLEGASPEAFARNAKRTLPLVGPLMLVEAGAALSLGLGRLEMTGLALLAAAWVSSFLLQLPLHRRLAKSYSQADFRRLLLSNWLRVALWTARGLLACELLRR